MEATPRKVSYHCKCKGTSKPTSRPPAKIVVFFAKMAGHPFGFHPPPSCFGVPVDGKKTACFGFTLVLGLVPGAGSGIHF